MSFLSGLFQSLPLKEAGLFIGFFWWLWLPMPTAVVLWRVWLRYARTWYYLKRGPWIMLEIRIPREILKTPKAMEQVFSGVWATITAGNRYEQLWYGRYIEYFTFEMVGMAGETHFFICFPEGYRAVIESYIWSEYPQADIQQVRDYFEELPAEMPSEGWRIQGTVLQFTQLDPYPIRTYLQFEDPTEERRIDPVAHFAELFNTLKSGEYVIYQLVMRPLGGSWTQASKALVYKLIGKKLPVAPRAPELEESRAWLKTLWAAVVQFFAGGELALPEPEEKERNEAGTSLMLHLSPSERATVEAIGLKTSKHAFEVNFRMVYAAREELFRPKSIVSGMFGATGLFGGDLNGFRPHHKLKTWVDYFRKRREPLRQKHLWYEMRKRLLKDQLFTRYLRPAAPLTLNIEELATIWHFPIQEVMAPLLPRIEAKTGEPPVGLPVG